MSANSTSLRPGHHRRQLSTPAPFDATTMPQPMSAIPPRRTHRRGQTMDYGSYGQQIPAVDRRNVQKTVPELRDFFNAKSAGIPNQPRAVQQFTSYMPHAEQAFISSGLPAQPSFSYQTSPMWSQEELQGLYAAATVSTSPVNTMAPALSRSASDNSDNNASLKNALHRMRQERNLSMMQREQITGHSRVMQPLSVQPEAISPKMNPYLSYTSPLTPESTPMKGSFDLSMYSNDQTPSKPQSFSIPRTPVSSEMQRAHSLQGLPLSSPMQAKHQMPSPAESPSASFAELAAMPSPGSCGLSDVSETPCNSNRQTRATSIESSPTKCGSDFESEPLDDLDLDARVKASVRETGVSNDEINKYISGPDPKDGKWVCLWHDCDNSRFGRKENIKSHVQTHLDDRPYKCDVCDKKFVRGHDLKRHLKTHTGKKPFACRCGASFARQDALTRHRQRDMCIGGYNGHTLKTTRRGRPPKKNRPDLETRQTKSTRTRQRVAEKIEFVSSLKSEETLQEAPVFTSPNYAPSHSMSSFTPPASPGASIGDMSSPHPAGNSFSSQFDDDMLPPLSPPQIAHARYEQAIAQFNPNMAVADSVSREYLYSDSALSPPHDMSSPHTAPTLAESSVGSEIDLFMTQDPSEQVQEEFGAITTQALSSFSNTYAYVDASDFPTSSFYHDMPEKTFSGLHPLDDPYSDQIDSLSNEFLVDP
ncbi:hypothetical protein N7462_009570 [Penicillium macrosclerotiorum]|uniref:uncharacterized protein n=1 Tax=Penicillium macrosclerotiorum TaxID=303699 RepID=UPI002546D069|nr:uncharacterized protein N7462_009570 [Penicillium macrosclerotiorum]KAJ5674131.1 hypothetical protein N7462_009570 [Penicillium macrosclerotiorum]